MRKLARIALAAGALALIGGAAPIATSTVASAQDVKVRVGIGTPNRGYHKYRPAPRYYYQRPATRYYYQRPAARYYYAPPRRYYVAPKRDFIKCRWVPHQGRVCW